MKSEFDNVIPKDKWEFDQSVTDCFENMLSRSIPLYDIMRTSVSNLAYDIINLPMCKKETFNILDIGCSDGLMIVSKFSANYRQNKWDEPAKTVLSSIQSALLYPEPYLNSKDYEKLHSMRSNNNFPRRLSVREHLRLQTVGDDFYFPDDISLNEQYNRCSGVPSLIAYKYGIAIADCLLGKTKIRNHTIKKKSLF